MPRRAREYSRVRCPFRRGQQFVAQVRTMHRILIRTAHGPVCITSMPVPKVLDHPLSGILELLDPRAGVDAVTAPGDPYGEPVRIRPEAGLLVIFPSWLYHWVHPYEGQTPRVAVSFNAALEKPKD